jgi:PHP family Zn ribbon phosphoesterase
MRIFIGIEITSDYGDILAYGIKSEPPRNMKASKALEFIHNQDGVAVCAHPFSNKGHVSFGNDVFEYDFDAIEINGSLTRKYNEMAKKAAKIMDIPTIGGSDAHSIQQLNTMGTKFSFRIKTMEDIINAIKNNKCKAIRI